MYSGPGVYEHYKGKLYYVLGLSKHSETEEKFVVYRPMYLTSWEGLIVRPLTMFDEMVVIEASSTRLIQEPRFKKRSLDDELFDFGPQAKLF